MSLLLTKTGLRTMASLCVLSLGLLYSANIKASEGNTDKKHFLGLFVGVLDGDETDSLLGIEYEYKFNAEWGAGLLYEYAKDGHGGDGITSKIAALYYHPVGAWRLGAGYGKETIGGSSHSVNITRLGVGYDFHIGEMGLAPSLNFDRINGQTIKVYGVAIIWSF